MAITNGYATEAEAQAQVFENGTTPTAGELAILDICVEAASRQIDDVTCREFYQKTEARTYRPEAAGVCATDDIATISGLVIAVDIDGDGTFETTFSGTDYQLEPNNALTRGWPYNGIRIRPRSGRWFPIGGLGGFLRVGGNVMWAPEFFAGDAVGGEALDTVQVTATWGWPSIPMAVKQACIIQAGMLYKAASAPFGVAGATDLGQLRITSQLHPTARALVGAYRRDPVLV